MKISYCVECGAPLQKHTVTKYACPKGHSFWNNPKSATGVIFRRGKNILYAVRGIEPHKGKLDVVGGFLEYNESPIDATVREVYEETGLRIKPGDLTLLGAFTAEYTPGNSSLAIIYECKKWRGNPVPQDDVEDLLWGPPTLITSNRFAWESKDFADLVHKIMTSF